MAIAVTCRCGEDFRIKDEAAGRRFQCPKCGAAVDVPIPGEGPPGLAAVAAGSEDVARPQSTPSPPPTPAPSPTPASPVPPLTPFERLVFDRLDQLGGTARSVRFRLGWIMFLLVVLIVLVFFSVVMVRDDLWALRPRTPLF